MLLQTYITVGNEGLQLQLASCISSEILIVHPLLWQFWQNSHSKFAFSKIWLGFWSLGDYPKTLSEQGGEGKKLAQFGYFSDNLGICLTNEDQEKMTPARSPPPVYTNSRFCSICQETKVYSSMCWTCAIVL